ncbi:MAG: ATP-binding cassette domain-containing protein [Gammaproteobacteria bacterium]|nr:ATP-binding cassette domain-containing protein [Gammaproteobacteria bacterium]
MSLISLTGVQLDFGGRPLLEAADLSLEPGERVCLIGRNGAGKSTLMKLIAGDLAPDGGNIVRQQGLRCARLTQDVPAALQGTVFDVVAGGLGEIAPLLSRYHAASLAVAQAATPAALGELARVQHELESRDGWRWEQQVETVISRLRLDPEADFAGLSGGLKRRTLLARALVTDPDLLLLDEPTNHLDLAAIDWLEEFLLGFRGTLLFVTHDRSFLQRLATRIVELDRGRLTSWDCDYRTYLERKEAALEAEAQQSALFDKKLSQEEAWIRQGIKARRTRNEGRVRALKALREQRRARREHTGTAKLQIQDAERSGRLVAEVENIGYAWDGKPIVRGFSTTILRGDKIGIIGPNGAGKTTLLRLLLGELAPQSGRVRLGTKLEVAYFDQQRSDIDDGKSVLDNLAHGREMVTINGQPRHIISYLQDFLFTPERIRQPAGTLSGGERNRLLLARLFTRPFNVLVMDEPTNDLDMETLELLEEKLLDYQGTLLLVSHDRAFLDNLVTSTLVFEGDGRIGEYVGGYEDWLRQRAAPPAPAASGPVSPVSAAATKPPPAPRPAAAGKLSYKEQRELEQLPARIEALEQDVQALQAEMSDPAFYRRDGDAIAAAQTRLTGLEAELQAAYARWETLEAR